MNPAAITAYVEELVNSFTGREEELGDLKKMASNVMTHTNNFCLNNNLGAQKNIGNGIMVVVANEAMSPETCFGALSSSNVVDLVNQCKIPEYNKKNCALAISGILNKYFNNHANANSLFAENNRVQTAYGKSEEISFTNLFPIDLVSLFNVVQSEDFGNGISKVIPDLRMAIALTIMQFHQGITARLVPVRTTNEPVVQYTRQDYKIYNVANSEAEDKDLIEVSKNPKDVTNELIKILPLKANDSATTPALVRDGVVRLNVEANLLKLAIDDTKYGHGRINRTDLVAEAPELDKAVITITSGGVTEEFEIEIPYAIRKLVQENNAGAPAGAAAARSSNVEFAVMLNKDSRQSNGTLSALLAGFAAAEGLNVLLTIRPTINLRTGASKCLGALAITAFHTSNPALISAGLTTFVSGMTKEFLGVIYDARYDEQNIRKSQIATRIQTRHMVQNIPPAKNYLIETAIGQSEEDNGASHIINVIKIGQDDKTLTTINRVMTHVNTMTKQMFVNPLQKGIDPGHNYVAGSLVRPRVYKYVDFNVNDVVSMKDSDRPSDIRAAFQMKLSFIIETLLQDTMLTQQLPGGQPVTFRCATSRPLLNTLFAIPSIHNHLDNTTTPSYDGIEFRRVLDSGVVIEFVTSLFDYMVDQVELIPVIPGAPDSILNFGHNWDYGTVLGNYNHSQDTASWNRTFASVREVTLPTNPMGIMFNIKGVDTVVRMP